MPSICARSVSPRNTLPRPSAKKKIMKKPSAIPPPSARRRNFDDELTTPRASTFDVRGEIEGTSSMTSSMVIESRTSSNPSPDEANDELGDLVAPKSLRCLAKTTKAKRIRFYRNGDQYYKGMSYALDTERIRSMKPLMEDLARAMGDSQNLPHGIRHIFSINGENLITEIDHFEDGESYVCSSNEVFKSMDYANAKEPAWCFTLSRTTNKNHTAGLTLTEASLAAEPNDFVEPRIITVIRNGVKPRRVVRHLLNKRTARSFEQVMRDLTAVVKLDSGVIRKLFALSGTQVTTLCDFFDDDYVFIAYGNEKHSSDDFFVISEECKRLAHGRRNGKPLPTRKRAMPSRNESLREDRCGSVVPDELARHLPAQLTEMFSVTRLLGDGNTALVYEIVDNVTEERKALKFIARENTIGKESLIRSELDIMARIEHGHVVKMFDSWQIDGSYYLSLELLEGGDLFEYMVIQRKLPERQTAIFTRCVLEALKYLHSQHIVHRDVKPENLLLYQSASGELELKLADFGLAADLPRDGSLLNVVCGTPTYVAPEVLMEGAGYDEKIDIWATGIIIYVMLCGFPPFQSGDGSQDELFRQIMHGKFSFPLPAFESISWSVKQLILCLVTIDMDERLSASEVLECAWITSAGTVNDEMESMAEFTVVTRLAANEEVDLEETEREYYMSRRASMDDLSESGQLDDEFQFTRSYS